MCILFGKTHLSKFGFAKLDLSTPIISSVKEIREGDQTTEIFRDLKNISVLSNQIIVEEINTYK